jgi:hypothetical protein
MRILYLGDDTIGSTSLHRADALRRLGHEVVHIDPRRALPCKQWIGGFSVRFSFSIFAPLIQVYLKREIAGESFDLVWVNCAAELCPDAYKFLSRVGAKIIHYQNDDPFGGRDGKKWNGYLNSLKYIDVAVVVREPNVDEALEAGAKDVHRVFMSYDPVAHAPVVPSADEIKEWSSDVSFIGTWMPERGPILARLIELGVPLTIRGNWWQKAPEWDSIRRAWKGHGVYGREYILSIQLSKVTLGLLSKGNRDLHTTRSVEVPFIGGAAFCAERTSEHEGMYKEGIEAEFWSSPEECAEKCFKLLKDREIRLAMVEKAKSKIQNLGLSNDEVMRRVLTELFSIYLL